MNKIKNFFTNTVPGWWRNHPVKLVAAGVGSIIFGASSISALSSAFSPKTSEPSSKDLGTTTSTVQTLDEIVTTTSKENTTKAETTTVGTTTKAETTTITTTDIKLEGMDNVFMSDYLKKYVEKVQFEDSLKPYILDSNSLLAGEGYIVDENGNITNSEGYTINLDGSYVDESTITYDGGFLAPDGLLYTSKEEYDKVLSGSSTSTGEVTTVGVNEDGYYTAPDGTKWNSEEDYKSTLIDVEGETIYVTPSEVTGIEGTYYIDEDGLVWESEEARKEFMNPSYDGSEFVAPDGTKWVSEEEYLKYLSGEAILPVQPPVEPPVENDDEFFIAPDGTKWVSEEAYNEHIKSLEEVNTPVTTTPTTEEETNVTTTIVEEEKVETTTTTTVTAAENVVTTTEQTPLAPVFDVVEEPIVDNEECYKAPDGSKWTSKEEYDAYIESYNLIYNVETTVTTEATTEVKETTTTTTEVPVKETTKVVTTTEDKKTTEESVKTSTEAAAPVEKPTTEVTPVEEPTTEVVPVENDKSDYYKAPDGSVWASITDYEAYLDYLEAIGENEVSKQLVR